jgi:hypothetical protein
MDRYKLSDLVYFADGTPFNTENYQSRYITSVEEWKKIVLMYPPLGYPHGTILHIIINQIDGYPIRYVTYNGRTGTYNPSPAVRGIDPGTSEMKIGYSDRGTLYDVTLRLGGTLDNIIVYEIIPSYNAIMYPAPTLTEIDF